MAYSLKGKKVVIFGATGMVGSALDRRMLNMDLGRYTPGRVFCDLEKKDEVEGWFLKYKPDVVFMPAALVGGIEFNINNQTRMLNENIKTSFNVINACARFGVEKLVYFGSSCQYPAECEQPMTEKMLGTGKLEPTNEGYAVAKNAACDLIKFYNERGHNFISLIPCNLYGPNDNSGPGGHVLAMLVDKHRKSNNVEIWGDGTARREFLHVDDLADAAVFLCENYTGSEPINVGSGTDVSIKQLSSMIGRTFGDYYTYKYDETKPNGMKQKLLDVSKLTKLGWEPKISLRDGLEKVIFDV